MRQCHPRNGLLLAFALSLGSAGCASGGGTARPTGSSSTRIVRTELQALVGQVDAYQAVERLRPRWLQQRAGAGGASVILYVDGGRRGNAVELRSLRISDIEQIEYMGASDATTRFGTGHAGGAILVTIIR